jgi:flagellar L-ring protein precursor FlgH
MKNTQFISILVAVLCASSACAESLYDESTFRNPAADKRARLRGDTVMVLVYENSSATTVADSSLHRNTEVSVDGQFNRSSRGARLDLATGFESGGRVQRSGRLLAQISAVVTDVAPNGDLWLSGEQVVEINADKQHIKIQGRVRPVDISGSNAVLSNRLADARIAYIGTGELAANQRPGFVSRVLAWLGL